MQFRRWLSVFAIYVNSAKKMFLDVLVVHLVVALVFSLLAKFVSVDIHFGVGQWGMARPCHQHGDKVAIVVRRQ